MYSDSNSEHALAKVSQLATVSSACRHEFVVSVTTFPIKIIVFLF